MTNSKTFHHAEHVGSLLRPAALRQAFRARRSDQIDDAALTAAVDEAVLAVLAEQEACGLHVVTDGEVRRASYWAHWVDGIDGLTVGEARFRFHNEQGRETAFTSPSVIGKLSRPASISRDEYRFAASHTDRTVKVTMPSPSTILFWRGASSLPEAVYRSAEELFADLCAIYRAEIDDLADAGCRYVQLDEVPLIMLADERVREEVRRHGEAPDRLIEQFIDALNGAVSRRPDDMIAAMHLCRGNYKGQWLSEGGYEAIAESMFSEVDVDTFFLEYDSERAGDFAPLRFVPASKRVVLGLVSSKSAQLEDPDDLRRRIEEAAAHVDISQLGLSPQCGFASTVGGNPVTPDVQDAKLRLITKVAADVWPTSR